jgi:hypothetical protein
MQEENSSTVWNCLMMLKLQYAGAAVGIGITQSFSSLLPRLAATRREALTAEPKKRFPSGRG